MISTLKCCLVLLTISVINFGDSKEINNAPQLSEKRKFINICDHSCFGNLQFYLGFLKESLVHGWF